MIKLKVMKKLLVVLILFFLLFSTSGPTLIFSEELSPTEPENTPTASPTLPVFDFDKAYQDYTYTYNLYLEAYKEYLIAKNEYETYKTLTAKTIALEQTITMLQIRDEVLATFLLALRIKLAQETNISSSKINLLYLKLDEEANWYRQHKETLISAGSIPDLMKLSAKTQEHYQKTDPLIYQSQLEVFLYWESLLHEKLQLQIDAIEEKIIEIRDQGDKSTSSLERWLLEAKNRKERSDEKLREARSIQVAEKANFSSNRYVFNNAISILEQAHQYLKETNVLLIEIIKEVKRGD